MGNLHPPIGSPRRPAQVSPHGRRRTGGTLLPALTLLAVGSTAASCGSEDFWGCGIADCLPPDQHCAGGDAVAFCAYKTCLFNQVPWWENRACPEPEGVDWACVNLADGRAECREVGADRCEPPGLWGCDGTWVTYCSASGYLGHVVDCAGDEMNPVCAVRDDGKAALCPFGDGAACTPEGEVRSRWCDGDYLTDCLQCLRVPDPGSFTGSRLFWLDTDSGWIGWPYEPFACHDTAGSSFPVHLRRCPAGCIDDLESGRSSCRSDGGAERDGNRRAPAERPRPRD